MTDEDLQRAAHIIFEQVNMATSHGNFPPESPYIKAVQEVIKFIASRGCTDDIWCSEIGG